MAHDSAIPVIYAASWGRKVYGGERILLNTFKHLDRSVFSPIAALRTQGELSRLMVEQGETVIPVDYDWLRASPKTALLPSSVGVLRGAWRLRKLIQETGARLIHVVDGEALQAASLAAKWSSIPLVFTMNNDLAYPKLDQWILRHVAAVIVYSRAVVDRAKSFGIPDSRLHYFVMGIDPEPFLSGVGHRIRSEFGIPQDAPLIGSVASLQPRKRQDLLLRAAPAILKLFPDTRFLLVGDDPTRKNDTPGSYEAALRNIAEELGIRDHVIFAGFRTDTPDILHALDIAVLCSDEEALGIANLEAMAAGIPVVATRVGGIVDVVEDGHSGLLVPQADSSALANAVIRLLTETALRSQMGEYGRQSVFNRFKFVHYVRASEALYLTLLRDRIP